MKKQLKQQGPNAIWFLLFVLGAFLAYLFWYNSENRRLEQVSYTTFLGLVERGAVEALAIQDQHVQGKLKNGQQFETCILANDPALPPLLHNADMQVTVYPAERQSWSNYLFAMALTFIFLMLLMMYLRQNGAAGGGAGKIFSMGKSRARFFSPNSIMVTFSDVAGVEDAKEDLRDIVEFLKNPEAFQRLGAKIPRGILLSGAPGNGKTLLAKAVAGEASCPFFSISGSDFVEVFVGVGASRVRDLFVQARKHSPCIVFIDEIDAVGRQRGVGLGGGNDEREQTLNQLLSEMDGFSTEHGAVIVIAATNRPDILDKALLRPGRFDRVIEIPYPDVSSREKILQVHATKIKLSGSVNLHKIARGTPGFSGADLENLINESALIATKAAKEEVEVDDFERARDKLLLGAERKTLIISEEDKRCTAYHESGHTLLNVLLPDSDPFHKVTIIPRGRALGVSWSLPEGDRHSERRKALRSRIMVALGGFLVEKMIFDELSSGVSSDLEKATQIARVMVCRFGMSDLGPIAFGKNDGERFLGSGYEHTPNYSEKTAEKIDTEVAKIIQSCQAEAEQLLVDNRARLDMLAGALLEQETLQADEVYALLGIEPRETHSLRA